MPVETINRLGAWFGQADGAVALAGGDDPQTHLAAYVLNAVTGNVGRTMIFLDGAPEEALTRPDAIRAVIQAIHDGQVDVVVVAGGANPVFSMPPAWGASAAIKRAPLRGLDGRRCPMKPRTSAHLLIPTHHALESWRDTAPRAGVYGLGQPVMQPVFASRPLHDILINSAHLGTPRTDHHLRKRGGRGQFRVAGFARQDRHAIRRRRTSGTARCARAASSRRPRPPRVKLNGVVLQGRAQPVAMASGAFTLAAFPHIFLYDGRGANKSWLQEIPEPVSQIVWDGWAEMHPDTAAGARLQA